MKFEKQCKCASGASGPRYIIRHAQPEAPENVLKVTVTLEPFACDVCNIPWKRINYYRK